MDIEILNKQALKIRDKYDELNQKQRGVHWSAADIMAGLVGDIGDLSKIIMAKNGLRAMKGADEKLAHELSDCLWSLFVLASKYDVDLPQAFMQTMRELEARIDRELEISA